MRTALALVVVLLTGCASTPDAQPSSTSPASAAPASSAATSSAATSAGAAPASAPASASADPGARADAILASVVLPRGSVRVATAPDTAIGTGTTIGDVPDADRTVRTEFWTTSTSAADTLAFLTAHPPKGAGAGNCCATVGDRDGSAQVVEFTPALQAGEANVDLQVAVGAVPGGGSGIRVGVEIDGVEHRGADQVLVGVTSVVLAGQASSGSAVLPVTLHGAPAAGLAADVNALSTVLGKGGCLPPGADITMTFSTGQGQQSAEFNGPCDVIWIGAGADDPGLHPSARLEADLGAALGLAPGSLAR